MEDAVERTVDECIHEGILAEFLLKNRAEVISMSIFEYDKDEEEKKLRKAEYEAGVQAGMEAGMKAGMESKLKNQIKKKLARGKNAEAIAEELEEGVSVVQKLIDEMRKEAL